MPSSTFVISYILRFWTPRSWAVEFRSNAPSGAHLRSFKNFRVSRPKELSYREPVPPLFFLPELLGGVLVAEDFFGAGELFADFLTPFAALVEFGDGLTTFLLAANVFDLREDIDFFDPSFFADTGGVDFTIFEFYDQ